MVSAKSGTGSQSSPCADPYYPLPQPCPKAPARFYAIPEDFSVGSLYRTEMIGHCAAIVLATRYKTMYWWLHSGYTDTKTKRACYQLNSRKPLFEGGIHKNSCNTHRY